MVGSLVVVVLVERCVGVVGGGRRRKIAGGLSPNAGGSNGEMQNGKRNLSRRSCGRGEGKERGGEEGKEDKRDESNLYNVVTGN